MTRKTFTQNVVYFPETNEEFHIVLIEGKDGKVRETLITPEEYEKTQILLESLE